MTSATKTNNSGSISSPIVVALDYANKDAALAFADQVSPQDCRLKVGKEMFTLYGPELIRDLHQRGFDVFLDLKFHDIPNTTARAVAAAAELGGLDGQCSCQWRCPHDVGGERSLVALWCTSPLLIAVTVLTSMDGEDLRDIGITISPAEQAERLAKLTWDCGLDGVVCSAHEAVRLKQVCGEDFSLVTPGIRPQGSEAGDQRRIMTPEQAVAVGVDYMVIGRPITQSPDPEKRCAKYWHH